METPVSLVFVLGSWGDAVNSYKDTFSRFDCIDKEVKVIHYRDEDFLHLLALKHVAELGVVLRATMDD